jgi:hypothetical protein
MEVAAADVAVGEILSAMIFDASVQAGLHRSFLAVVLVVSG